MLFRKTVFLFALVGSTIPVAFANSGGAFGVGESNYETQAVPSTKNRTDVKKESQEFRNHLTSAHGVTQVNGETGGISPRDCHLIQSDVRHNMDGMPTNTAKPALEMTAAERRMFREIYVN